MSSSVKNDKLDRIFCVHLGHCFALVGLISPPLYLSPPLLLLLLLVQQTVVEAHGEEEEHTGNHEDNTASLVGVLVIVVDVFEPPWGKITACVISMTFSMALFRMK